MSTGGYGDRDTQLAVAQYNPAFLKQRIDELHGLWVSEQEENRRLRAELEQSEKEADSLQDAIEEVCDGPDCTGKGCNSFGHDEDCEISDGAAHLRRYVGSLRAEIERACQMLEAVGVTRDRARNIANGVEVLASRHRKERRILSAELERTKKGARGCMESCHRLMDYNEGLEDKLEQSEARVRELHRRAQKAEGRIERVQHWVDTWEGAEPKSVAHQVMLDEIKEALANSEKED